MKFFSLAALVTSVSAAALAPRGDDQYPPGALNRRGGDQGQGPPAGGPGGAGNWGDWSKSAVTVTETQVRLVANAHYGEPGRIADRALITDGVVHYH